MVIQKHGLGLERASILFDWQAQLVLLSGQMFYHKTQRDSFIEKSLDSKALPKDTSMMSHAKLKQLPSSEWMNGSRTPMVHEWLSSTQTSDDRERLHICGNIVIPAMANFAMHILHEMW